MFFIKEKIPPNINIIIQIKNQLDNNKNYFIGDLIISICKLIFDGKYNKKSHHYNDMSKFLNNSLEFISQLFYILDNLVPLILNFLQPFV